MKYLKEFNNISEYNLFKSGSDYITPNVSYTIDNKEVFYNKATRLFTWVDLGLPSGLKWASCNVGANRPEEYGLYFAWGETEGYTADDIRNKVRTFSFEEYKFSYINNQEEALYTKYVDDPSWGTVDNLTTLLSSDDAAHLIEGNGARIPTGDELQELIDYTTPTWEILNGVEGVKFTANNGNYIFIPAAGYGRNDHFDALGLLGEGTRCSIMSSSVRYTSNILFLMVIHSIYAFRYEIDNYGNRTDGYSVRAVKD